MMALPEKEWLRVEEVAQYYSVSNRTIYLWLAHGHLVAERLPGRSIRITRKSVQTCRLPYRNDCVEGP
jgi:excisionase family DNA binding protein